MAQNPNNGQTVIKSVYKKDNSDIQKNLLEGRRNPSSVVHESENGSVVPARLSALQQTPKGNITVQEEQVNSTIKELLKKWRRLLGF